MSQEELKEISLEGLLWFKKVCEAEGLRYYLAYGTLLGAVRHKGFIPWDDDIDVWMPRQDYDRLIRLSARVEDDSWQILSNETQPRYLFPWAKVAHKKTVLTPSRFNNGFLYGVSLDIFPLDPCEGVTLAQAKEEMQALKQEYTRRVHRLRPYSGGSEGVPNRAVQAGKMLYYHAARVLWGKMEEDLARWRRLQRGKTEQPFVSCALAPVSGVWPRAAFEQTAQLEFENTMFDVPKGYNEILTLFYGDYMTLPPVEKRVTHHSFRVYRR